MVRGFWFFRKFFFRSLYLLRYRGHYVAWLGKFPFAYGLKQRFLQQKVDEKLVEGKGVAEKGTSTVSS